MTGEGLSENRNEVRIFLLEKDEATYLGVDLGGTKLLIGEMTSDGRLLRTKKYPSGPLSQPEALEVICRAVQDFLETVRPENAPMPIAMGVGLVGRVNSREGIWLEIDSARAEQIPIGAILSRRFGLPCFADNDVRSAAKAEVLFGMGRQSGGLIYINVGTGIAAGIMIGGRMLTGSHYDAGEVGHMVSGIPLRVPCPCGRMDCVEPVASGAGFDKCARMLAARYPETRLHIPQDGSRVRVEDVFALYGADPLCTLLTDNGAQAIANLVMNLVRTLDPDTVVLGGGVMSDGFLYPHVMQKIDPYTVRFVTNGIVLTRLDAARIGLMGACSNAIEGLKKRHNQEEQHENYDCKQRA